MKLSFLPLSLCLSLYLVAMYPGKCLADVDGMSTILDEIAQRLPAFNGRMGVEPLPVSGLADARFSRFEPNHGFMEHWGSALRVRWSVKLLSHGDGRVFIIYQYLMGFPDSSSTEQVETTVKLWFFERSKEGRYRAILQEDLTDESPLIFRFGQEGAFAAMDDGLHFVPYVWNGRKLLRK